MVQVSRRTLLLGSTTTAFATSLGACVPQQPVGASVGSAAVLANAPPPEAEVGEQAAVGSDERQVMGRAAYGPVAGERFPVPAAPLSRINPAFLRSRVSYASRNKPGTIVIDPAARYLYFVEEAGRAMRYGVGVGKEGFAWSGTAVIHDKQEWAGLVPSQGDDPAQTRPSPSTHRAAKWHRRAWWPCKSARRARHVSLARQQGHAVSDPRHQRALDNWHERLVRLHPHDQSGCDRPVRADCHRDECCRAVKRLSPHRMIWPEARPMCPEVELIRALSEDLARILCARGLRRRRAVYLADHGSA